MQQQQADGSYQELWPKNDSYNKTEVLSDSTRKHLGLESTSVPNDAFGLLAGKMGPVENIMDYTYTGNPEWYFNVPFPSSFSWNNYNIVVLEIEIVANSRQRAASWSFYNGNNTFLGESVVNNNLPNFVVVCFVWKNPLNNPLIISLGSIPGTSENYNSQVFSFRSQNNTLLDATGIRITGSQMKSTYVSSGSRIRMYGIK